VKKPKEVRTHQTGPIKEKRQVTLRLDGELLDAVEAQCKEDGFRMTDAVERGLGLYLEEMRHHLPAWATQVRFVLANATKEQERRIRGLAVAMVEGEVVKRSAEEQMLWEICEWFLLSRNSKDYAKECLESYSKYRREKQ
jgi:hypothetical protein